MNPLFNTLSLRFAKILLKNLTEKNSETFLCYLFEASKKGHICLIIEKDHIFPSARELFPEIELQQEKEITKAVIKGSQNSFDPAAIYQIENRYYLQKNWVYETQIIKYFSSLIEKKPENIFDDQLFSEKTLKSNLLPEQIEAVKKVKEHSISLILGGPGTGKSYTVSKLISICMHAQKKPLKIVISAPTGKAAFHLKEKIPEKGIDTMTLHSLLQLKEGKHKPFAECSLDYDLIIIDEASMIDAKLMAYVLTASKGRLLLLGDPDQLPAVEAGNIFSDLTHNKIIVTKLKTAMRFESQQIHHFAEAVKNSDPHALDILKTNFINIGSDESHFLSLLWKKIEPLQTALKNQSAEEHLADLLSFRLLSPLRSGILGVQFINRWILKKIQKKSSQHLALPILITKNHHVKQLYNGMIGIFLTQSETAYFPGIEKGDVSRKFSKFELPSYEYAFCLSVHKSQGSEFEEVFLLMPQGSEVFGREILYTAATRAKKRLEIAGSLDTIQKTLLKRSIKYSGLNSFHSC